MKSRVLRNKRRFFLFFTISAVLSVLNAEAADRGPLLVPPVTEADTAGDDVPNKLSRRVTAKRLPTSGESALGYGQPVRYDMPLMPTQGTIIPQEFLEEEPLAKKTVPSKPPRKLARPLIDADDEVTIRESDILYEDDLVLPGSRRRYFVAEAVSPTAEGETVMASWAGTDDNAPVFGGVYDECSPSMDYGYAACPIIKPFGTGVTDNLTFLGGVTAFRNELDWPEKGNFGFMEGVNWSGPATAQTVSAQLGFRAVQSNLHGSVLREGDEFKLIRSQYFLTAGLFKRDLCSTVQAGAAYDWCFDEYYGKITLQQIRVEAAVRTFSNLEYGFQGAFGTTKERSDWITWRAGNNAEAYYRPQNCYLFFGRKHFHSGGLAELRLGATDRGDIILGGLGEFPINDRLSLNGGFSLLCPKEGNGVSGWRRETWELSVGMIFYFRGGACSKPHNPCRPMFDVAGNGSFFGRLYR